MEEIFGEIDLRLDHLDDIFDKFDRLVKFDINLFKQNEKWFCDCNCYLIALHLRQDSISFKGRAIVFEDLCINHG